MTNKDGNFVQCCLFLLYFWKQRFRVVCRILGRYNHTMSERLGRTSYKEQYSYVYRYCFYHNYHLHA